MRKSEIILQYGIHFILDYYVVNFCLENRTLVSKPETTSGEKDKVSYGSTGECVCTCGICKNLGEVSQGLNFAIEYSAGI